MIIIVAAFTVYFYIANRKQSHGKVTLEGVVSYLTHLNIPPGPSLPSPPLSTLRQKLPANQHTIN